MNDWTNGVPRDVTPPPEIRRRLVSNLRAAGHIRGRTVWRRVTAAAAAMVIFAAGWAANGAYESRQAAQPFILFLYGGAPASGEEQDRVAEYREWAEAERARGRHTTGERFDAAPSGYFVVEAPSLDAARDLAARHPHVRHGGTIVVRAVAGG